MPKKSVEITMAKFLHKHGTRGRGPMDKEQETSDIGHRTWEWPRDSGQQTTDTDMDTDRDTNADRDTDANRDTDIDRDTDINRDTDTDRDTDM